MTIRLLCFAGLREILGRAELQLDLEDGTTVGGLKATLEQRWPALAGRMSTVRVAAGHEFLRDGDPLPANVELALIPPVSGGRPAPVDMVRLSAEALTVDEATTFVAGPDAGALVTFHGTVRALSRGRSVVRLEYEAYPAMAIDRLAILAEEARQRHGASRVAVLHRTGGVPVGGLSVVIAVSAAHRDEAFSACRHVIEGLKADVPIWKKEIYEDGQVWVGWGS